jgi:hypothetical protein
MKTILVILMVLAVGCIGSNNAEKTYTLHKPIVDKDRLSALQIVEPVFDFGTVKAGAKVKHVFYITNNSKTPLIIKNATTSCGCTVAAIPEKPILLNQRDSITTVFSSSATGMQNKVINLYSNSADSVKSLTLIGRVVE